jgi:hypothetical protein
VIISKKSSLINTSETIYERVDRVQIGRPDKLMDRVGQEYTTGSEEVDGKRPKSKVYPWTPVYTA